MEENCFIPEDLLFKEILPKVPTKSILRFKSVSKSWLARITSDSAFIADHTKHHSTTEFCSITHGSKRHGFGRLLCFVCHDGSILEKIDISYITKSPNKPIDLLHLERLIGVCNGLVLLSLRSPTASGEVLVVWNPATREFRFLPDREPTPPSFYTIGFGMDTNMEYRVVRINCFTSVEIDPFGVEQVTTHRAQLLTRSSGRWRKMSGLTAIDYFHRMKGLTVDGTIHWAYSRHNSLKTLSLDSCGEEFQKFDGPPCPVGHLDLIYYKGSLGAVYGRSYDSSEFQVWMRVRNNDDRNSNTFSWTKMATCHFSHFGFIYVGILRDRIVFHPLLSNKTFLYDLVSHKTRELVKVDLADYSIFELFNHIHSLVSPD